MAISAAKGYLNYLDLVEPDAISYQMACATTLKLDNVLYVQQEIVMNGRRIYRDESEINGNYLMYDYADYTWRITPDYHAEQATLFNTSDVTCQTLKHSLSNSILFFLIWDDRLHPH